MKNDEIDDLLASAVGRDGAAEPRPGLEQRVLTRVRTEKHRGVPRWVFAVPALATVAFVFVMTRLETPPVKTSAKAAIRSAAVEPVSIAKILPRSRRKSRAARKPDFFPTPAALTAEELALVQLVTRAPEQARGLIRESAEIRVSPIQLEPIVDIRRETDED
ncbi:MAG: hypothetical protein WKF37_18305 [Bryobacteraceae bacterium]